MPHFTPTESRLIRMLADGQPHPKGQLVQCLPDELATFEALRQHILRLREKLEPIGQTIVCVSRGNLSTCYRHVRLLDKHSPIHHADGVPSRGLVLNEDAPGCDPLA